MGEQGSAKGPGTGHTGPGARDWLAATGIMSLTCSRGGAWDLSAQKSNAGWIVLDSPAPTLCFPRSCKRAAGLRARHDCVPLSNG
ncbi:hypothetical protein GCM10027073_61620 [Streptomyces chlorus]